MIPTQYSFRLQCDACGAEHPFRITSDDIDTKGLDMALEDALREEAWEVMADNTFCPSCVDRALAQALQSLAQAAAKLDNSSAEVRA
jgi:hypothetical protein